MILLQFNFNCATQWHYGLLNSTSRGDVCDSRKLWILQTRGPHSDTYIYIYIYFSVSLWVLCNKSQCSHSSPACSLSAGFTSSLCTHTQKKIFHHWWRLLSGGRRKQSASPPSVPPPPQVSERLLGRGLEVKLYSLFGWGWRYLVRAAGLLAFLEMGDLAT